MSISLPKIFSSVAILPNEKRKDMLPATLACTYRHALLFYVSRPYHIRVPRYNTENVIRVPRYNTENVILRCAVQKSPRILGEI